MHHIYYAMKFLSDVYQTKVFITVMTFLNTFRKNYVTTDKLFVSRDLNNKKKS